MKKTCLFFFALSLFLSCDKAEPPFFIQDDPFLVYPVSAVQNVLVENFAAEWSGENAIIEPMLDSMHVATQGKIIPVTFHDNDWLATPYSTYLAAKLGGYSRVPMGSINRVPATNTSNGEDGKVLMQPVNWIPQLGRELLKKPVCFMAMKTEIHSSNKADISIYLAQEQTVNADTRLLLYFIEDAIPANYQQDGDSNFVHQNTYIDVYPSQEGALLDLKDTANNKKIRLIKFSDIDLTSFNVTRLKVVAFVYQVSNNLNEQRVLNAQTCKMGAVKLWGID